MTTRRAVGLAAALAGLTAGAAAAGWKEVQVDLVVPPAVATQPGQRVLVALFRGTGPENIDVGLEVARWVRREAARDTNLSVLDAPPPPIPEQRPERLAVNDAFWRQLGEDFGADVILAGVAEYRVEDSSGFVAEDAISPVTGQTVRRMRFAERRGHRLRVELFVLKGDNGALLHSDVWNESRTVEGFSAEDLQQFYELLDALKPHLKAVLLPTKMQQPRYIWVN